MDVTVLGLVTLGVFGIFYVVFTWSGSSKKNTSSSNKNVNNSNENIGYKKNHNSNVQRKDLLQFIDFEKISDDMIIQEKGNKYTMIIQCKGINYDLMSEVEQLSVEEGFITFLNTLKSPIQLYVQARTIDLRTSLNIYKEKVEDINRQYTDSNERLTKLSENISATQEEVQEAAKHRDKIANIAEYAQDITKYVEKLSLNKHLLQRKFYITLSYYKSEVNSISSFSKKEIEDICYRELYTRAQSIIGGLQACSVSSRVLDSNEIAELLYISYNRDDEKLIDIKTALDSGFYRMYSTSKDVHEKRAESMEKIVQEEAMKRVQDAVQTAIESGIIKTQDETIEEFENESDVTAVKILEEADIDAEEKRKLQEIIVNNHNDGVDKRQKQREERAKAIEEIKSIDEKHKAEENNKTKENETINNDTTDTNVSDESIV